jgi:hypothetical protein
MAPGQARGEITGIWRWIARDKRGRAVICGERLGRRTQRIEAGAEIQHAGRSGAAMSPVNSDPPDLPDLHRLTFIVPVHHLSSFMVIGFIARGY